MFVSFPVFLISPPHPMLSLLILCRRSYYSLLLQRVASGAAAAAGAAMVQAPQAMALVDERLNGDGARLILGVNEPILGWVLLSVFGLVWAFYATSVKGISNNDDEDSGLSL